MSYSAIAGSTSGALSRYPQEPMPLDIKALQALYGEATSNAADTVYDLARWQENFHIVLDSGGNDTLDARKLATGVDIDLTPGAGSKVGLTVHAFSYHGTGASRTYDHSTYEETLRIDTGSWIENAVGSSHDDVLAGNQQHNLLQGGDGNDMLRGRGGNDVLDGGAGTDTACYDGSIGSFRVERFADGYRVVDRTLSEGSDLLTGIERLQFADMGVDLTVRDAAAPAAGAPLRMLIELYTGFFNRIPDAEGLGFWLGEYAAGTSMTQIANSFHAAALAHPAQTGYTAGMSNADFVNIVYKNVHAEVPHHPRHRLCAELLPRVGRRHEAGCRHRPGRRSGPLLAEMARLGLTLEQIWLTHAHIDHAGGTAELAARLGLPIIGPHPGDQFWIDGLPQQGTMFGFPPADSFTPTRWLHDGDTVELAGHVLHVRHCPGHTPGHVVFYSPEMKRAFVGDVLFAGSIGRTDFPRATTSS
jgi:hypothetical protein